MKRIGNTIYAVGQRGVYQVSFGGVQKIWQEGAAAGTLLGPGVLS